MIWTDPGGSQFYVPDTAGAATAPRASPQIREFLREIGKRGGRERALRHPREELATWGAIRHGRQQEENFSGRQNRKASTQLPKQTVEQALRLRVPGLKRLDGDVRVDLGHGYTAFVRPSATELSVVVSGPGLPEGGLETNVRLRDRPVYGWARSSRRPIYSVELECAQCHRAVRYVYLTRDSRWACQKCSGLTWESRARREQKIFHD